MNIQFLGAAQTVTGSCYIIEANGSRFAVDCGLHQGNAEIEKRNNAIGHYDPKNLDFILITHAHIDHTGLLPALVREGFSGRIYCTEPTRDLLGIMLLDSAHIQEMEAEWKNKKRSRKGSSTFVRPLYTKEDAVETAVLLHAVEYNTPLEPASGLHIVYKDAGHILGSAFLEITVDEGSDSTRMIFSGDMGRPDSLIVSDPDIPRSADYLFLESTYGDRNHKDTTTSREELAEAIAYSYKNKEKVIIPAFAVERTQEVLYTLFLLHKEGKLPADMPIFVDSPLAIRATEIFKKHPNYFDDETKAFLKNGEDPLSLEQVTYTLSAQESQTLNTLQGAAIIISAGGMCNAGRIKHHLRHNLWRPGASIVFVGYQALGTPGRKIVDGEKTIRLFNEDIAVKARVYTIGGFSAHAGQSQLVDWVKAFATPGMEVYLIHGEEKAQRALAGLLTEKLNISVCIPEYLEKIALRPGAAPVRHTNEEAYPRVDWTLLLDGAESKLMQIRSRLAKLEERKWVDQTEARDRLVEINRDLLQFLSQI